jgi:hypothetical protein
MRFICGFIIQQLSDLILGWKEITLLRPFLTIVKVLRTFPVTLFLPVIHIGSGNI